MSSGWNFPLSDEENKAVQDWKERSVYPAMLKNQRGTRYESIWKIDPNTGAETPYEGSIGGILSYHFYPSTSLLCEISNDSPKTGRVVVYGAHGINLELRPTRSADVSPCCVPGPSSERFFISSANITSIREWVVQKQISIDSSDLSYVFAPTNLGVVTKVVLPTGDEFDFTEYDDW